MHYKCKKCNYEFDVYLNPHSHNNQGFVKIMGCPICAKANAMSKVCPKCGSKELTQTINNIKP